MGIFLNFFGELIALKISNYDLIMRLVVVSCNELVIALVDTQNITFYFSEANVTLTRLLSLIIINISRLYLIKVVQYSI